MNCLVLGVVLGELVRIRGSLQRRGQRGGAGDGFKTRDEMVPCLLLLSLLLGLVHVCWPDPADPEGQMNWSQCFLLCDGGPQGPTGGCEAEVLVRGKNVKVNPAGSQAAAASLLLGLVLFGVCVAWLLLGFSTTNNLASQAGLVFFSFGFRDLKTSEVYLSFWRL